MNLSKKSIIIFFFFITIMSFISCKKSNKEIINPFIEQEDNPFIEQEGMYVGLRHYRARYTEYDLIPIAFDSITSEPVAFEKIYTTFNIDTIFADTVMVKVISDSIFFDGFNEPIEFPISESNVYRIQYPGYTSTTFTIKRDSIFIFDTYVIDRGSDIPGGVLDDFAGNKE